jgi:ribosomal protein L11 methyltransferase
MLAAKVKLSGRIALSGILAEQADDVIAIYSQWFAMNTPQIEDGWVCLSGTRK